jgi:DNA-binding transcriptional regulator YiaG
MALRLARDGACQEYHRRAGTASAESSEGTTMARDETEPKRRRSRAAYRVAPVWDAERVRALRQHLGLTQDAFSTRLGIRQQTVSEWEVGKHAPRGASRTLLTSIAERAGFAYRVDPEERDETRAP